MAKNGKKRAYHKPKMSLKRGLNLLIAFGPAAAKALNDGNNSGGLTTRNGWLRGVLPSLTQSYIGYNTNDGKFYPEQMIVGYGPIAADVFIARKLINRAPKL